MKLVHFLDQENKIDTVAKLKREVDEDWWFWRPIVEGVISLTEANEMSKRQLTLVNRALDKKIERENQASSGKGGK